MNIHPEEDKALGKENSSMIKACTWSANFEPAEGFVKLGEKFGLKDYVAIYKFWAQKTF